MKTIELHGQVDGQHRLSAQVPNDIPPGPVKFALVVPSNDDEISNENETEKKWMAGISREWAQDLADPTQDIYTLNDGEPVDETR
jgi:hypothetical protein